MGRRKEKYFGARSGNGSPRIRMSVSDRKSKAARPWNDPDVVGASEAYGVPFGSNNHVALHENRLESIGSLEPHERMTCNQCGNFNKKCTCTEEWS
jgi:hypothetical protein